MKVLSCINHFRLLLQDFAFHQLNSALDIDGTEAENSELAVADKKPDISADKKPSIHDRLNAIKERQESDKKPKLPTPNKENEI